MFEKKDFDPLRGRKAHYLDAACIIGLILLWGIYLPITAYVGRRFWHNRNYQVLKKRYSDIACIEITLVMTSYLANGGVLLGDYFLNAWLRNFTFYTGIMVQYTILYCWLWRFWLLYYDIQWLNESLNVEWKRLINPHSGEDNFYIVHRATYGNQRWVANKLCIVLLIANVIVLSLRIPFDFPDEGKEAYEFIGEVPYLIFLLIPFVCLAYIFFKLPDFDDNIFIAKEMKSVICVLSLVLTAFALQEIGENTVGDRDDSQADDNNIELTLNISYYIVIESCNFVCILITTVYVMNKVKSLLTDHPEHGKRLGSTADPVRGITPEMVPYMQLSEDLLELQTSKGLPAGFEDEQDKERQCSVDALITFKDVLQHPKAFELFVHHVAKEFSIECLLSFVEFIQFKRYMFNHLKLMRSVNDIRQKSIELYKSIEEHKGSLSKSELEIDLNYSGGDGDREEADIFQEIEFPSTVPRSEIVFEDELEFESNDFIERAKHKIYRLYCKYVRLGCDLEINISHRSRQALARMMDDEQKWMKENKYQNLDAVFLMHIFDKCIAQMRDLLQCSFFRFKNSKQFVKLTQCVFLVGSPR